MTLQLFLFVVCAMGEHSNSDTSTVPVCCVCYGGNIATMTLQLFLFVVCAMGEHSNNDTSTVLVCCVCYGGT